MSSVLCLEGGKRISVLFHSSFIHISIFRFTVVVCEFCLNDASDGKHCIYNINQIDQSSFRGVKVMARLSVDRINREQVIKAADFL